MSDAKPNIAYGSKRRCGMALGLATSIDRPSGRLADMLDALPLVAVGAMLAMVAVEIGAFGICHAAAVRAARKQTVTARYD